MIQKILKTTVLFLIVSIICSLAVSTFVAFAEEDDIVVTQIQQNYSPEGNTLPSLLDDGYSYTVSVYEKDGTTLIEEKITTLRYKFPKPGEYVLKWSLENIKTGERTTANSTIKLVDIVAPELFLNGGYDAIYCVGDVVDVYTVSILDDSGEKITNYATKILFNNNDITASVNGKITLEKGKYQITYTAVDSTGNEGVLDVYFEANETTNNATSNQISSDNKQKNGCKSAIYTSTISVFATIVFGGIMFSRKKGGKKND